MDLKQMLEELSAHLSNGICEDSLRKTLMFIRRVPPQSYLLPMMEQVLDQLWELCGSQQWASPYEELVNLVAQPWLDLTVMTQETQESNLPPSDK